jgi:hypothetical protein
MSNYVKRLKLWAALLFAVVAYGQQTTTSTTLSSAVNTVSSTQWCLASATGVIVPNTASSASGSLLLADREVAQVTGAGYTSTCFKVKRGQMGSAVASHSAASIVWVGQPSTSSGDSSRPFTGAFITTLPTGSCVSGDQYTLPVLFVGSASLGGVPGTPYDCISGQWSSIGNLIVTGKTNTQAVVLVNGFGASGTPTVRGSRALGTPSAPSAVAAADLLVSLSGTGYGATGFASGGRGVVAIAAAESWTDSAQGTRVEFWNTPNGSTTNARRWFIDQDGGLKPWTSGSGRLGSSANLVEGASFVNCTSGASPAVCGASVVGAVAVAAAATSLVVNTTAVTAKSRIVLTMDSSLGSDLGITCNTTNIAAWVSARTAGTSFTITTASGPVTNAMCLNYTILN